MSGRNHHAMRTGSRMHGVTLIELMVFIVVAGIVAVAMVQAFSGTMRGSYYGKELTQATQLAQQRMEFILGQRRALGYANFSATTYDPCALAIAPWPATQTCSAAGSYTVSSASSSFAADACGAGTGTNCRLINVVVTGPYGDTLTQVTTQVWSY